MVSDWTRRCFLDRACGAPVQQQQSSTPVPFPSRACMHFTGKPASCTNTITPQHGCVVSLTIVLLAAGRKTTMLISCSAKSGVQNPQVSHCLACILAGPTRYITYDLQEQSSCLLRHLCLCTRCHGRVWSVTSLKQDGSRAPPALQQQLLQRPNTQCYAHGVCSHVSTALCLYNYLEDLRLFIYTHTERVFLLHALTAAPSS
jgi:hypothetical protein